MPTAEQALPGGVAPSFNAPAKHVVNGNRIQPPFPTQGMRQGNDVGTQ